MKKNIGIIIVLAFLSASCQPSLSSNSEKSIEEIMSSDKFSNADLIRNVPEDTVNVAKLVFTETEYDFGEATEGEVVTHTYTFVNQGKIPLVITGARSTCGCTVPEWPKTPVPPGKSGEISVKFNTAGKRGPQKKPVTVTANTYPAQTVVDLIGVVHPKDPATAAKE